MRATVRASRVACGSARRQCVRGKASAAPQSQSSAPGPQSQSGGGMGKLLLVGAVAAPLGYATYMVREDAAFRETVRSTAPAAFEVLAPYVLAPWPFGVFGAGGAGGAELDGMRVSALKTELDDLQRRWESNTAVAQAPQVVRFSKEDVDAMTAKVAAAEAEAETKAKAEAKTDAKDEDAAGEKAGGKAIETAKSETKADGTAEAGASSGSATAQLPAKSKTRQELDLLKAKARQVQAAATAEAGQQIAAIEKQLRDDVETVLAHDVGSLDEAGLRKRVVQLVLELQDRNKWEAQRMHELTKRHTADLAAKYDDVLREQADRYEELLRFEGGEAAMRATEEAHAQAAAQMQRVLQAKEQQWQRATQEAVERQRHEVSREFDAKFNQAKASLEARAAGDAAKRVSAIERLKSQLGGLQATLSQRSSDEAAASAARGLCMATLDLQTAMYTHPASLGKEIEALRAAAKGDAFVEGALASISPRILKAGVASEIDLLKRFETVYDECYRAAITHEDAGVLEHAVARVVAALTIQGKGNGHGEGPEGGKGAGAPSNEETRLLRARQLLVEEKDLAKSLDQMDQLHGLAKDTASDWIAQAKDRVVVEQAIVLVKSHIASF